LHCSSGNCIAGHRCTTAPAPIRDIVFDVSQLLLCFLRHKIPLTVLLDTPTPWQTAEALLPCLWFCTTYIRLAESLETISALGQHWLALKHCSLLSCKRIAYFACPGHCI
jgi:hypothetical protein